MLKHKAEFVFESGLQQDDGGTVSMKRCCTLEDKKNTNQEAAEFTVRPLVTLKDNYLSAILIGD